MVAELLDGREAKASFGRIDGPFGSSCSPSPSTMAFLRKTIQRLTFQQTPNRTMEAMIHLSKG